jgi:Ca2+-binding RTX toxin-like protein
VIEAAGEGTDFVYSTISYVLGNNVEDLELVGTLNLKGTGNDLSNKLWGNSGANELFGGKGDDHLQGRDGNDLIYGGQGNDWLYGGNGANVMFGGKGNDVYVVDSLSDTAVESFETGVEKALQTDIVHSSVSFVLGANIENLRLFDSSNQNIDGTGNTLSNWIRGNAGNNILNGLEGDDLIQGYGGNDTIYGGPNFDTLYGDGGDDMIFAGRGNDELYGGDGNDNLLGGMENDTLFGEVGADILLAGQGADILLGGAGDDLLNGALGADTLTGGDGSDTFAFSTALSSGAVDTIKDFSVTDDKIQLSRSVFSQLTQDNIASLFVAQSVPPPPDGKYLAYCIASKTLYYDADGTGTGGPLVAVAVFEGDVVLAASHFQIVA